MALTRQQAREVIEVYIQAWETQDPELIAAIFTDSATYHERVLLDPLPGREAIRRYWQSKVVKSQANAPLGSGDNRPSGTNQLPYNVSTLRAAAHIVVARSSYRVSASR
jgi:SnoaL-like protein